MRLDKRYTINNDAKVNLEIEYKNKCRNSKTLAPLLPILNHYARQCDVVIEFGVNSGASAIAIMAGYPKKLTGVDVERLPNIIELLQKLAKENKIDYSFIQKSSIEIKIEPTDLLFIDSLHLYEHLKQELTLHHENVRKLIIMHDTVLCADKGMDYPQCRRYPGRGLMKAIREFLLETEEWVIHKHYTKHYGMMVLKRKGVDIIDMEAE